VAGPESANNSACSAQMIPLLSLGLPFSSSAAILLGGFMIHGISPGPLLMTSRPEIFWGLIASLYVANLMLLVLNLPMVGLFASLLKVPLSILMPVVAIITFTGAYAINYSVFDLGLLLGFGVLGYFLKVAGFEIAPLAIGVFLGPAIESGLVQGLTICDGSFLVMLRRPIAGTLLAMTMLLIAYMTLKQPVGKWVAALRGG
jgi:putative tricarboxylic transport membrane protein